METFQFKRKEDCEQMTQGSITEVTEMDRAKWSCLAGRLAEDERVQFICREAVSL